MIAALMLFPVPLWLVGVAFLAGVCAIPALISAVWVYDARKIRKRAEEGTE